MSEGRLIGHIVMGLEMINPKIAAIVDFGCWNVLFIREINNG